MTFILDKNKKILIMTERDQFTQHIVSKLLDDLNIKLIGLF